MAQSDTIKSYLVSLSTNVDQASFAKFASVLAGTEKTVASAVGGIAGNFLKFQVAATTAFATVGFGIVAYIDKLGQADLKTKLLATQNMMGVQQYRAVTTALDTLGVTLNDVFFGTKELQDRFHTLIDDQKQLALMLGPNYEDQMRQIRDVTFQLQRLEVKGQYFGMKFASDLLEKLGFGNGGIAKQLERLNDFVLANMPRWSDEITNDLVPALNQMWDILKKTGNLFVDLSVDFDDFVGTLSGDDSIDRKTASFESFAKSVEHVVFWIGEALKLMVGLEQVGVHSIASIWDLGKFIMPGVSNKDAIQGLKDSADEAVKAAHGFENIGAAVLPGEWGGDKFEAPNAQMNRFVQGQGYDFQKLVRGIAQVESGGQQYDRNGNVKIGPDNPSGERAVGMMQLLPSTARRLGVNPYDPSQNLEGGSRYLAQLLQRHQGNVEAALADYGGAKSQYSPQGQDYIRKVESAAGIQVGSIIVNVPSSAMTPNQTAQAVKQGVDDGLTAHTRRLILAHSGAYQ
jgi:hypothetical protein